MSTISESTISNNFKWSSIQSFGKQGISLIFNIILARLLSPYEFGLISIVFIFITISNAIVDSGFTQALVRKKKCTELDYNTVFYTNLIISIIIYLILISTSKYIALFFKEPILEKIINIISTIVIINGLSIIHRSQILHKMNFKNFASITTISNIVSVVICIILAYMNFGIWSLVIKHILQQLFELFFSFMYTRWLPSLKFSFKTFKELYSFGYKLMLSTAAHIIVNRIYYFVIAIYNNTIILGNFFQGEKLGKVPSEAASQAAGRVVYSSLSKIKDNNDKLKAGFKVYIKFISIIITPVMVFISLSSETLVLTLLGSKWIDSVFFISIFSIVGIFIPLIKLNSELLLVKGRSDIFLYLEIIKILLVSLPIYLCINFNLEYMMLSILFITVLSFILNAYPLSNMINYSFFEQMNDLLPSFIISIIIALFTFFINSTFNINIISVLLLKALLFIIIYIFVLYYFFYNQFKLMIAIYNNNLESIIDES